MQPTAALRHMLASGAATLDSGPRRLTRPIDRSAKGTNGPMAPVNFVNFVGFATRNRLATSPRRAQSRASNWALSPPGCGAHGARQLRQLRWICGAHCALFAGPSPCVSRPLSKPFAQPRQRLCDRPAAPVDRRAQRRLKDPLRPFLVAGAHPGPCYARNLVKLDTGESSCGFSSETLGACPARSEIVGTAAPTTASSRPASSRSPRLLGNLGSEQHKAVAGDPEPVRRARRDQEHVAGMQRARRAALDPASLDQRRVGRGGIGQVPA